MEISPVEVEVVLSSADNLNAALKTLLKREGRPGNTIEPFVKSFRNIVSRKRDGELLRYVEDNYATRQPHFAMLMSYAFPSLRESVAEVVFEKYADTFNATFERSESGLKIVDPGKFKSIAQEVVMVVKAGLDQAKVPSNNFSVHALLATIFEPDVLGEVLAVL